MSDEKDNDEKREGGGAPRARRVSLIGDSVDSRELFSGRREITIVHGVDRYRLRLTAQNKLILTK